MAREVRIDSSLFGQTYFCKSDHDRSYTINTQSEVYNAVEGIYQSRNICTQAHFQKYDAPKLEKVGWKIPNSFKSKFQALGKISSHNPSERIGWVKIPVPFTLDVGEMVNRYFSQGRYEYTPEENLESIWDAKGRLLFQFKKNDWGDIEYLFSPCSRKELRNTLMWLPKIYQSKFSCLLGLPDPPDSEFQEYVHERLKVEGNENGVQETITTGPYDPDCHVRRDGQWHAPRTIRDGILCQCSQNPLQISFPAYGVRDSHSAEPVLKTGGLNSCIGLIIRDRKTTRTLLGHFPTDDSITTILHEDLPCVFNNSYYSSDMDTLPKLDDHKVKELLGSLYGSSPIPYCYGHKVFPYEWYIGVFQQEYFSSANPLDIDLTIISGWYTPSHAVKEMRKLLKEYFPGVASQHLTPLTYGFDFQVDSRNGLIKAENSRRKNELPLSKIDE